METKDVTAALGRIEEKAGKVDELEQRMDETEGAIRRLEKLETRMLRPTGRPGESFVSPEQKEHLDIFTRWLRAPHQRSLYAELESIETKAASGGTDAAGGALVPELLLNRIIDQAKDLTAMRSIASVESVSSGDVKFPISLNNATSGWVAELGTRSATSEPTLIERKPTIGTSYAYVACSEELMYDSRFDISNWFSRSVAAELALAEGTAFVSGDGSNKPTGILNTAPVADLDASPAPDNKALLYVPTGVAGAFPEDRLGSPAGDPLGVLSDAVYALKTQDRAGAVWLMNSSTMKVMSKWKDADGRPLVQPSVTAGAPATLMGYRIVTDEAMPDIGSNTHPVLFGNFRKGYIIIDAGGMRVTVDDNITVPGTVKYYVRKRVGGIVADQRAVVAIKAAAS